MREKTDTLVEQALLVEYMRRHYHSAGGTASSLLRDPLHVRRLSTGCGQLAACIGGGIAAIAGIAVGLRVLTCNS